jgi:SAM-dependent methyltransferase
MSLKFSHKFPKLKVITNRERFLRDYAKGKVVLHGGCVDSGLFEERKTSKLLLHDLLGESAKKLVGVDVDKNGIEEMVRLGYKDVYFGDLEHWNYPEKFDLIILGEIIEHVDNCGAFLQSVTKFCKPSTEVIFTTPNNYYFLFWLYTLFGKESIHPDHNYLFSFYSLRSLLGKFGFDINKNIVVWEKVNFNRVNDTKGMRLLKTIGATLVNSFQLLKYIAPQYGKGIIVIAKPKSISL